MLKLFAPKKYVKDFRHVDLKDLENNRIKLVICDIDNTLVAHDEKHPNQDVHNFVRSIKEAGMEMILIMYFSSEPSFIAG